jgi:hypothetical protein
MGRCIGSGNHDGPPFRVAGTLPAASASGLAEEAAIELPAAPEAEAGQPARVIF